MYPVEGYRLYKSMLHQLVWHGGLGGMTLHNLWLCSDTFTSQRIDGPKSQKCHQW